MTSKKQKEKIPLFTNALIRIKEHFLFGAVANELSFIRSDNKAYKDKIEDKDFLFYLYKDGYIIFNVDKKYTENEWLYLFAILVVHYCFNLIEKSKWNNEKGYFDPIQETAYLLFVINYLKGFSIGEIPQDYLINDNTISHLSFKNEDTIYEQLKENFPKELINFNFNNKNASLLNKQLNNYTHSIFKSKNNTYSDIFADSIVEQAQRTLNTISKRDLSEDFIKKTNTLAYKARNWFIYHYPLLGALASSFNIIEDVMICQRLGIGIAAVSVHNKEIYINTSASMNFENLKFVIAHEILHVALEHIQRRNGRDPFLWNVACDYVINDWLIQLNLGIPPDKGLLYDPELTGLSSDEIYILLAKDIRKSRKLMTLRGDKCDMFDEGHEKYFQSADDFCKRALQQGVELYNNSNNRSLLPAGLVEEIRSVLQPPIPWNAKLAEWMRDFFPVTDPIRTYARPSRRQSATPDIIRASYKKPEVDKMTRTFGVVVDSSASMDRLLLGKALGAIASYALAQEVSFVRLIFCDADAYDEGFISVESLLDRIKVKGRGGTIIQKGINLLENAKDFPKEAPILIITDAYIEDDLVVKREHAFLIPEGMRLPFITRMPIFYLN